MRSTMSLRFVAVSSVVSLALAWQHADAGSGFKGRAVMNGSSHGSGGVAKSFSAKQPSVQRSFGPTGFRSASVNHASHGSGSPITSRLPSSPLTIKKPSNTGFPNNPFPVIGDKGKIPVGKLPGFTPKLTGLTPKLPLVNPLACTFPKPCPNPGTSYCLPGKPWCGWKPKHCWWWFDYCLPLQGCHVNTYCYYDWNYVTCDYYVAGRPVAVNARWYLGVKGMILPGKGLGIEEVDANSPAAGAGLAKGMVIVRCNGIELTDEQAVSRAIRASNNGRVQMDVLPSDGAEPSPVAVQMVRLANVSY